MIAKARALVLEEKPFLLIGSPPCTAFSSWQALNAARLGWTAQDSRRRRAEGELHVRFCCEVYKLQAEAGTSTLLKPRRGDWLKSKNCSRPTACSAWSATNANMGKKPERATP